MLINGSAINSCAVNNNAAGARVFSAIANHWVSTRYRCLLTGAENGLATDVEFPIKSFQTRFTSDYIYLSCVVPGVDRYQDAITERSNGRLKISRIYDYLGSSSESFLLVDVPFDSMRLDSGGRSGMTATLSGNEYNITVAPQTVELFDPVYYAATDGALRRYRCRLDPRLRVGDTAIISEDSLTVGTIIHIVDVKSTLMEIAEA